MLRADSFATGMLIMMVMTVVQRSVGFGRSMLFCRWMTDDQLGQWAMAFGFITMCTPLLVLGLSGSLARYVQHYRDQGHLRGFVSRVAYTVLALSVLGCGTMVLFPDTFSWLVFKTPQSRMLIAAIALAVFAYIYFSFITELVASLRQVRVVSMMQFVQSIAFTALGLGVLIGHGDLTQLCLSHAIATVIGSVPGVWILARGGQEFQSSGEPMQASAMWRRLLPYAASLWMMNLLANAFEFSDRYMILHLTSGGAEAGQSAVGQYHTGRLFPT
ncbi:MAG: oligosaccharide flippase family protein, partial [Planctomycetota bacterium]